MNTRSILLAYATRYGSTQEVAETITAALRQAGLGFFERMMPARDHRDWAAIRAWANALSAQLQHAEMSLRPA